MDKPHRLSRWLNGRMSQIEFAEKIDCSASHLSLMLSGDRGPSYELAKRVSRATNGAIWIDAMFTEYERLKKAAKTAACA